jgi:hypothetical protein
MQTWLKGYLSIIFRIPIVLIGQLIRSTLPETLSFSLQLNIFKFCRILPRYSNYNVTLFRAMGIHIGNRTFQLHRIRISNGSRISLREFGGFSLDDKILERKIFDSASI